MRFDNYRLRPIDKPGYPDIVLNGEFIDTNTFRKIYADIHNALIYGINDIKGNKDVVSKEKWYRAWRDMLYRGRQYNNSYSDVVIGFRWLKASNFKRWYNENIYEILSDKTEDKLELDKDIRRPGNKIYCPEDCLLVPGKINGFFINSYKVVRDYKQNKYSKYKTGVKIFGTDKKVSFSSDSEYELNILRAKEKNRQLRELVIPYFLNLVHPSYMDSAMVQLVLKALEEYDFVDIEERNRQAFEVSADELKTILDKEDKVTLETIENMRGLIEDTMSRNLEKYNMACKMENEDVMELLDIMTLILAENINIV